jgi:hypothetical protein
MLRAWRRMLPIHSEARHSPECPEAERALHDTWLRYGVKNPER